MIPGFEKVNDQLDALTVRGDLVSRKAAIDALAKNCKEVSRDLYEIEGSPEYCRMVESIAECLKDIPPAQQWIPCSERLPEKPEGINEMYLAQYSWGGIDVLGWAEGWNCHYNADGDVDRESEMSDVIAWQPLPEPYKEVYHEPGQRNSRGMEHRRRDPSCSSTPRGGSRNVDAKRWHTDRC